MYAKISNLTRVAFTDDQTGFGKLDQLKIWLDQVMEFGPYIGYNVNQEAKQLFAHSQIRITTDGNRHFGSVIGDSEYTTKYVANKIDLWITQLEQLIIIAKTQPHDAYCAFVHCLKHKYIFIMRTVPNKLEQPEKLYKKIDEFIKTILNGYKFKGYFGVV